MPRARRIHAPNAGIHITARIQGRVKLFEPELRDEVAYFITEAARPCGHLVLAFAVMPNHFHIVLKQAQMPLGWMMQRVMQRTMRLMKRTHDVEDHVFGGPYWSCVCGNVRYVRQAMVYTHLNPWKAGLSDSPDDVGSYRWTSHNLVAGKKVDAPWAAGVATDAARSLFADDSLDPDAVIANYLRFIRYWKKRHKEGVPGDKFIFTPPTDDPPSARLGDDHWAKNYSQSYLEHRAPMMDADVRDRAISILTHLEPDCTLDMIRHAGRVCALGRIRRELIAALLTYGYRGSVIARCLRVSHPLVCDVAAKMHQSTAA